MSLHDHDLLLRLGDLSREELAPHWKAERRFEPRMAPSERQSRMTRWREAVRRSRSWTATAS